MFEPVGLSLSDVGLLVSPLCGCPAPRENSPALPDTGHVESFTNLAALLEKKQRMFEAVEALPERITAARKAAALARQSLTDADVAFVAQARKPDVLDAKGIPNRRLTPSDVADLLADAAQDVHEKLASFSASTTKH